MNMKHQDAVALITPSLSTALHRILGLTLTLALLAGCRDEVVEMVPEPSPLPEGHVEIEGDIDEDTTFSADTTYILTGRLYITEGATLTIEAGTHVLGDSDGAVIVTRGSRLVAEGTAEEPVVFSSSLREGSRSTGDWGGVAMLGAATMNSGACIDDGDPDTEEVCDAPGFFQGRLEGIDVSDDRGRFGGNDDTSDCGSLRYVRIEFAGAELSPDNELNGLTLGACGTDTTLSHIQVHRGKDDGIEFFGGTAGMDHVVISGASDDSLDWDLGWRGEVQFLVVHQYPGNGDHAFESDNNGSDMNAEPRSMPTIWNATLVGTPNTRGMKLREGTWGALSNFIITEFGSEAFDVLDGATAAGWPDSLFIASSVFFGNGAFITEDASAMSECTDGCDGTAGQLRSCQDRCCATHNDDDEGIVEAEVIAESTLSNVFDVDPMLGSTSVTAPDYVPAAELTAVAPGAGFDQSATYAGAFEPNSESAWTDGWTAFPIE